jgi:2',3'-cyclic-nucleotide 2'-phosphodiesterase (5'-nucleotidase family)
MIVAQNIAVKNNNISIDSNSFYFLKPFSDSLNSVLNVKLAFTDSNLNTVRQGKINQRIQIEKNANLGRILSDYLLKEGSKYTFNAMGFPCHIALINHGGIRSSIPKGDVTNKSMYEIMPFENEMVILEINGQQMDSLLSFLSAKNIAAVSGLTLEVKGNNYTKATIAGLPFDSKKSYWIVANDYVQKGGYFFNMLKYPKQIIRTGIKLRTIFYDGFKSEFIENQKINPRLTPRIIYND